MTVLNEPVHTGGFILSEEKGTLSRDGITVTVPARTVLQAGLVLGKITATGKYVPRDEDASDGSEVAAGILYSPAVNHLGDAPLDVKSVTLNFKAEVHGPSVDANGGTEATVLSELLALGIKVRGDLTNVAS